MLGNLTKSHKHQSKAHRLLGGNPTFVQPQTGLPKKKVGGQQKKRPQWMPSWNHDNAACFNGDVLRTQTSNNVSGETQEQGAVPLCYPQEKQSRGQTHGTHEPGVERDTPQRDTEVRIPILQGYHKMALKPHPFGPIR